MSKTKSIVIIINLLLLLAYFNWSIAAKESTLNHGRKVLLELAPVDPRSLIQGDYMRLNYKINQDVNNDSSQVPKRGYFIVAIGQHDVASRVGLTTTSPLEMTMPLKPNELLIKYFSNNNRYFTSIRLGAESYFFEEGQAKKYQAAKYGCLKVDDFGNSVLEGLYDAHYQLIK